jgi:hypothetical protein
VLGDLDRYADIEPPLQINRLFKVSGNKSLRGNKEVSPHHIGMIDAGDLAIRNQRLESGEPGPESATDIDRRGGRFGRGKNNRPDSARAPERLLADRAMKALVIDLRKPRR